MKKVIFLFFILFVQLPIHASTLVVQADSAYTNDDFQTAITLYNEVIKDEGTSSTLYYNLGNAYYRLGQLGNAIVSYERALRLDPTNSDAKANLAFVNSKITDKPIDSETFLSNTFDKLIFMQKPNTWAWMALVSFILLLSCVTIYIFSGNIPLRKIGFFGGIVMLIITIVLIILALNSASKAISNDSAIITSPSVMLSTSPRIPKDRSEEAVLLHEGTKVEIVDSISSQTDSITNKWYEVKIDNINRAWINASDVVII